MDLDDFKQVNDTYGHGGDQLLNGFGGTALQSTCRRRAPLIRLGGDEVHRPVLICTASAIGALPGKAVPPYAEAIGSEPYHLEGIDLNPP